MQLKNLRLKRLNKLLICIIVLFLALLYNVNAVECNVIELGNYNWTWEFGNKGFDKVGDDDGTIMHTPSNLAVYNYSASGVKGNQVFSIPDQGTAGLAANTSNVWIVRNDIRIIREYDYAGNSMSHDVDYLGGSTCGACGPDISLEPNSSNVWFIGRGSGGKGKIYRYDVRTAAIDFMFHSGSNGTVGIYVDGERIYVSNQTHIRQLDYAGNVICDFAHGLVGTLQAFLSGNSSTLLFSAVGAASGNLVTFDVTQVIDTTPPIITLINLTSEGGIGQVIDLNNKQRGQNKTNDTTPTFFIKTNEATSCAVIDLNRDLNYSDITAGSSECSSTGGLTHTCTLPSANKTGIGLHNFSIGCKDSNGNENLTSTSGKFLINITDSTPPAFTLFAPDNDTTFQSGLNSTIAFTFFATDNIDSDFITDLYINNVINITNSTYLNGTNVAYSINFSNTGTHFWWVRFTDKFGNINDSENRTFEITEGLTVSVSGGVQFEFRPFVENNTLRTLNISCTGQNNSIGCLNVSVTESSELNFSLLFNITVDPPNQRIIEDFSVDALNWTVFQRRSNNTLNKTILNASVTCGEIQSLNSTGLIEYRFNNTIETVYTNSSNESVLINTSVNCPNVNYYTRILNGTQKNITGFDSFNFSWKGDNSFNTVSVSLFDDDGTKASSNTLTLSNIKFNTTGISLGSLTNISIINITVTNVSGTSGLSGFFIDNLRLMNLTSTQSSNIKMKANCGPEYHNSTLLVPDVWTNLCVLQSNTLTKYIWLWQDINLTKKGISWLLQYNASKVI